MPREPSEPKEPRELRVLRVLREGRSSGGRGRPSSGPRSSWSSRIST